MCDIDSSLLSRETREAISEYLSDHDMDGYDHTWWSLENFAGLFFRLKFSPDDPALFPKGKWATLQRMETLIEEALKT